MLQRITSAAAASSSPAGSTAARSMASLHTPVASCSYTPLRAAAHRVSALPQSRFGQSPHGFTGAAGLMPYSTALAGSSLGPQHSATLHGLQPSWANQDRYRHICALPSMSSSRGSMHIYLAQ